MNGETGTVEEVSEQPRAETYEVHIRVPREMQMTLKKSAQLAHKLGLTTKPELAELMNLFVGWGMNRLKVEYLKRMGYK